MRVQLQLWLQVGMKGTTRGRFDAGTALLYEADRVEKDRAEKEVSEGGKIVLEISDLTEIGRKTRSRLGPYHGCIMPKTRKQMI